MSPKRKELIQAVLDGKRIQKVGQWPIYDGESAITCILSAAPHESFNVLSSPVVHWCVIDKNDLGTDIPWAAGMSREEAAASARNQVEDGKTMAKLIRLEIDPDTLNVISARTEEP